MSTFAYNEFYDYIWSKGIIVLNCKDFDSEKKITMQKAKNHMDILSEMHKKVMGYEGSIGFNLPNNIGKLVEGCKVEIKKNNRFICYLQKQGANNNFESLLLDVGDDYIKRAERCVECVYNWHYIDILYRSMRKCEICIRDSTEENIRKDEHIEIANGKNFCYEILEVDAINYLNKFKRKGVSLDYEELIAYFCNIELLDENSNYFIKAMISYPFEFMKCLNRYKRSKKPWTLDQYEDKLLKAIEKDGISYI
ncbi:hypothetical protein [Clostridium amazonitimonense]|uniref:hypothetical protein n=1 Tax=Clostridium amazonitimonense TaxID=1499689 RepID=UPI00050954B7|nr:hypothetical protein [Clostridium amazonitimonense]